VTLKRHNGPKPAEAEIEGKAVLQVRAALSKVLLAEWCIRPNRCFRTGSSRGFAWIFVCRLSIQGVTMHNHRGGSKGSSMNGAMLQAITLLVPR